MAPNTSRPISRINFPLVILWLGSVGIAAFGYLLMSSGNADQVLVYTAVEADYVQLFASQSASTVGGMLIAVGVLGVLLALTAQTITRRPAAAEDDVVLDSADSDSADSDDETLTRNVDAAAEEAAGETKAKPKSQAASKSTAAPRAKATSTSATSATPASES